MINTLHIYTRVSTTVQEEMGSSLDTQKELGISKSKNLGYEYRVWNEGGQSSSKDDLENRPVLVDLLKEIDEGNVKHLFVFNTDRLSRNDLTWSVIRLKLVKNDVTLHTSQGVYPLSDPMNKLLLGILSEISSYDNQLRTERSRLGKLNRIKQGYWKGGPPPFGYKIEDKKLIENKDESKWVKFIFESYRDNHSARWIKQELLKNSVFTRRKNPVWSLGSIEKLLSNTQYSGYYHYTDKKSGETIRVQSPAILSPTLFKNVSDQRKKRTRQTRSGESNMKHFYLLRDYLRCGQCGSRYSGRHYERQKRSIYYCPRIERNYVNENTNKVKKCDNRRYLKIEETDKLIWNTVIDILTKSNLFKEEVKSQSMIGNSTHNDKKDNIRKLSRKLKEVDRDISEVSNTIVNLETDKILKRRDSTELSQILTNVETYRVELESDREIIKDKLYHLESKKQWVDWISKFSDRIDKMSEFSLEEKHEFLNGVIDNITVSTLDTRTHEVIIKFKMPYVEDSIKWNDKSNKSKGYTMKDGGFEIGVEIDTSKKFVPK